MMTFIKKASLSLTCLLFMQPLLAQSQSIDSYQKTIELGNLLASEQFCQLSYDQDAIINWIDNHTDPSDLSFSSNLSMMTSSAAYELESLSASQKTTHCRAIERSARYYDFIE